MKAKQFFLVGFMAVLLVGIPAAVYLVGQQQQTQSRATAATTNSFSPDTAQTPIQKQVGDPIAVDVVIDPASNQVKNIQLDIQYDNTKLATASAEGEQVASCSAAFALKTSPDMPLTIVTGPTCSANGISVGLSTATDLANSIQTKTTIGTFYFRALAPTEASPLITFTDATHAYATGADNTGGGEDVIVSKLPANIAIGIAGVSPTVEPTGISEVNQSPLCTSLNADRELTGTAPYSLTFTGVGTDPDGTISKATFNFGDGPTADVTSPTTPGSYQVAHTYNNAGTFQASVIFTDNRNGISEVGTCTQTITIASAPAPTATDVVLNPTTPLTESTPAVEQPTQAPQPLPATGPGDTIVTAGAIIGIISAVGAILFFAL